MTKILKQKLGSLAEFVRYFLFDLLTMESTRVQLLWLTAFSWATIHLYFGAVLPIVRELSSVLFQYYCLPFRPINLDSPHASQIMNSSDLAFMGTVGAYVVSKYQTYKEHAKNASITEKQSESQE